MSGYCDVVERLRFLVEVVAYFVDCAGFRFLEVAGGVECTYVDVLDTASVVIHAFPISKL